MASYEAPGIPPKITFYTYPDCPWCQRVHFILTELKIPVDQVFINLDEPRPQWYLDINPVCSLERNPTFYQIRH